MQDIASFPLPLIGCECYPETFATNHMRITILTKASVKSLLTQVTIAPYPRNFCAFWTKQVTVEDPKTGEEIVFSCQRWFSTSDDDGKISRELVRDDKDDATIIVSKGKDYW